MDKKQQIEEIAGTICNDCKERFKISKYCKHVIEPCIAACAHAEAIYSAGYRKIDENCAVITKAEWKEYQKQAYSQVFETLTNRLEKYYSQYYSTMAVIMQTITDEIQTIVLDKYGEHLNVAQEIKELKQRAVKEFAEKLKEKACRGCIDELIEKLLKEHEE